MPSKIRIPGNGGFTTVAADWQEGSLITPGFRIKKNLGLELPVNAYSFDNYYYSGSTYTVPPYSGSASWYVGRVSYAYGLATGPMLGNNPYPLQSDILSFDGGLREKVRSTVTNLPVVLAEFPQTCRDIASIALDVYRSMKDLIRGQPREAIQRILFGRVGHQTTAGMARGLANRWLQWSFSVKPLLSDALALTQGIQRRFLKPRSMLYKTSAFRGLSYEDHRVTGQSWNTLVNDHISLTGKMRGQIVFAVDNPQDAAASAYQLDDPASLAWELIPFSFVVDWFVPIGAYLSSLRDVKGLTFVRGWRLILLEGTRTGSTQTQGRISAGKFQMLSLRRTKYSAFPPPHFPGWSPNIGVSQVTSAIALITQAVTGGFTNLSTRG